MICTTAAFHSFVRQRCTGEFNRSSLAPLPRRRIRCRHSLRCWNLETVRMVNSQWHMWQCVLCRCGPSLRRWSGSSTSCGALETEWRGVAAAANGTEPKHPENCQLSRSHQAKQKPAGECVLRWDVEGLAARTCWRCRASGLVVVTPSQCYGAGVTRRRGLCMAR